VAGHPLSLTVVASRATSSWRRSAVSLVTSALVQGIVITALIVLPLLATSALPRPESVYRLPEYVPVTTTPPYEAPPTPKPPSASTAGRPTLPRVGAEIFAPVEIADTIADPPEFNGGGSGVAGGLPLIDGLLRQELGSIPAPAEPPPPTTPVLIRGDVKPPRKIVHVAPVYPAIARGARREGTVILRAIIDAEGNVVDLSVVESVPLLDEAALEAVSQWKYEPTLLNGQAVPVVMTVQVDFRLRR
jgi:protein TonB